MPRRETRSTKTRPLAASDPPGTLVRVTEDDGRHTDTRTRSAIWKLSHGANVVLLSDRTSGYLASRCRVLPDERRKEQAMSERNGGRWPGQAPSVAKPAVVTEPQPPDDRIRRLTDAVLEQVWDFLQSEGECPNATPICGTPAYCSSDACGFCGMAQAMEMLNVAKFKAKMRPA